MHDHHLHTAHDVATFTLAGNATITLESEKTHHHFTYRVRRAEGTAKRWFVSLLNGPDNTANFVYVGLVDAVTGQLAFRQTAKAKVSADAPSVRGFKYFWNAVSTERMPKDMIVRHEGKCGRCGRKLTVPESIDRGIGPECAGKLG
jgi:hypothetical protein